VKWLSFVRERLGSPAMPMGELFAFELREAQRGKVKARARADGQHYNPLGVVQGGFAATVLDIALGLVSITMLPDSACGVSTIDLSVTYLRPVYETTGWMAVEAEAVHAGSTVIIARALLKDGNGKTYAMAQSNSLVLQPR
jgi:uncharacterized protein (TIGR00369 family)